MVSRKTVFKQLVDHTTFARKALLPNCTLSESVDLCLPSEYVICSFKSLLTCSHHFTKEEVANPKNFSEEFKTRESHAMDKFLSYFHVHGTGVLILKECVFFQYLYRHDQRKSSSTRSCGDSPCLKRGDVDGSLRGIFPSIRALQPQFKYLFPSLSFPGRSSHAFIQKRLLFITCYQTA